jgi:predicted oxidoreductase
MSTILTRRSSHADNSKKRGSSTPAAAVSPGWGMSTAPSFGIILFLIFSRDGTGGELSVDADVIVVGAGLAGLVAAAEAAEAGRRVLLLDQEPEQSLGGQAWWSFGGLFFVGSPEQRRLRVHDDVDLAWRDWTGTAGFDRAEDEWPRRWARAYVEWAAGEKRAWLASMGHSVIPVVGWAERGGYYGSGIGNSVPRFHVTWGTGPGMVEPSSGGSARRPRPAG